MKHLSVPAWIIFFTINGCLSKNVGPKDVRQCYWCGPLADQVHRSQRPSPCDSETYEVTSCDSPQHHCAIVASAPPFVESRMCVKIYQDECYPLYCNTTRSWKMTCPCKGDLCNGPNTEREEDAFAGLAKLVSRTHSKRQKRVVDSMDVLNSTKTEEKNIDKKDDKQVEEIGKIDKKEVKIKTGNSIEEVKKNADIAIDNRSAETEIKSVADVNTQQTTLGKEEDQKQSISEIKPTEKIAPAESFKTDIQMKGEIPPMITIQAESPGTSENINKKSKDSEKMPNTANEEKERRAPKETMLSSSNSEKVISTNPPREDKKLVEKITTAAPSTKEQMIDNEMIKNVMKDEKFTTVSPKSKKNHSVRLRSTFLIPLAIVSIFLIV